MSLQKELWVGYTRTGSRATVRISPRWSRVLLAGSGSTRAACIAAIASKEAGLKPTVLDLGGHVAESLSGHLETFDYRSLLYDACRLAEPRPWHSQLVAGAYSAALDLTSEEEAIMCAALHQVASQDEVASPISVYNVMGQVEGFRGFYVDKLKGRIGSLRFFDSVDDQKVARLAEGSAVVDFHRAPYPQAAELGAALILAKLLAMEHSGLSVEGHLMLTEAHRLFPETSRPSHGNLLLTEALSSSFTLIFATEQPASAGRVLTKSCSLTVHSSESWHAARPGGQRVMPGSFLLEDDRSGEASAFVPRFVVAKTAGYSGGRPAPFAPPELTRNILETVGRYPYSTADSLAHYLAPEYLHSDVASEVVSLERHRRIVLEPKEAPGGVRVFAYTLTEDGRRLLGELSA